jgi:hypothetical protein
VLLAAIAIGQVMGYRVLDQSTELHPAVLPTVLITPEPLDSNGAAYGPGWQRSQTLSAAPDPGFPDPRVPPVPLPTLQPQPKPKPTPVPTATPNPNIPIWDRSPFPPPEATPAATVSPSPTTRPEAAVATPGATSPPRW